MTDSTEAPEQDPNTPKDAHWGYGVLGLVCLALLGWCLFSVASCTGRMVTNVKREVAEADQAYQAGVAREKAIRDAEKGVLSDTEVIAAAQTVIKNAAVDPASVRFRNVRAYRQQSGMKAVCGEFNAKNRAGGYNGFERFISAGVAEHTWTERDVADFESAWASLCHR